MENWLTDITRGIKSDDQDFDEDDDAESVSSEVSESNKPVPATLLYPGYTVLNGFVLIFLYSRPPTSDSRKAYFLFIPVQGEEFSSTEVEEEKGSKNINIRWLPLLVQ